MIQQQLQNKKKECLTSDLHNEGGSNKISNNNNTPRRVTSKLLMIFRRRPLRNPPSSFPPSSFVRTAFWSWRFTSAIFISDSFAFYPIMPKSQNNIIVTNWIFNWIVVDRFHNQAKILHLLFKRSKKEELLSSTDHWKK